MKKIVLGGAALLLLFAASCKDDDNKVNPDNTNPGNNNPPVNEIIIPETNISLVNKLTGSLCGPCGAWGWTGFEQIMTENGQDAIYMGTYSQNFVAQLFITQAATDMDAMFKSEGYPTFTANGVPMIDRTSGVNVNNEIAKVKYAVAAHTAGEVYVNSGFKTKVENDILTIETKTKFFKEVSGDLFLAVYVMEDKVKGFQQSHPDGNNTLHHHVLRGAATLEGTTKAETFGYKVNVGATTPAGTILDNKFTFDIKGYNKDNIEVAVVVWRKLGVRYKFINANSDQK